MLPQKLAFVDVETTGLSAVRNRIIEIGILRIENGRLVNTFQSLVNPQCFLPDQIEFLTGITKKHLESSPSFSSIKNDIKEILDDSVFVAHNVRFDYSFLKNEFKREGLFFSPKQLCTVKLFKRLYPHVKSHNLDSIIENFSIACNNRHRAFDDAKVLWDFYQKLFKQFSENEIAEAISFISKSPSLPLGLCKEDIQDLPETAGVYIFYDRNNIPLYIGKSKNIKERVKQHFLSDYASGLEAKIAQTVTRIESIKTAGDLGALLKEATLIKKMQPLYNRRLRRAKKLTCLIKINIKGYDSVKAGEFDAFMPNTGEVMGVFKSKKKAKDFLQEVSKKYSLCRLLLGLDQGTECFAYRLNRCKGACKDKELPAFYNVRFINAFSKVRIEKWPFNGAISVIEKDSETGRVDRLLIDNWRVVGLQQDLNEVENFDKINFDLDTYRIINSFLKKKENLKQIVYYQNSLFQL